MGGKRADRDLPVPLLDRAEVADPADVNHDLRLRQPELHGRDQTVAPREHFRVLAVFGEKAQRLVKRRRPDVVERGGIMTGLPSPESRARPAPE